MNILKAFAPVLLALFLVDCGDIEGAGLIDGGTRAADLARAATDAGGPRCAIACAAGSVCCPGGYPCAGTCVPDCRLGGSCLNGGACNQQLGICGP